MNLIQIESFIVNLNQMVSQYWSWMIFQALVAPSNFICTVRQNLIRVFILGVLQPIIFSTLPLAISPNLSHEASRKLVNALLLMSLH